MFECLEIRNVRLCERGFQLIVMLSTAPITASAASNRFLEWQIFLDIRKKPTPEERFYSALFNLHLLLESDQCLDISSTIALEALIYLLIYSVV